MSTRQAFQEDLKTLEQDLIEMASLAEQMLARAVESLVTLNESLALETIRFDDEIDRRDLEIEQHCLRILALQQPMAKDLRVVGTCMKAITDIERIGDLSVDIAKIALKLKGCGGDPTLVDIPKIANLARKMLRESIEAFVKRDLETVYTVCRTDDEVDALYRELRGHLHEVIKKHPEKVVEASWLLLAIHHLERVADHATNIAERVFFMETGRLETLAASHKADSQ
ncbi:MAG: phosphate signaling complex protein PhoU [Fimbriimonadales bacterium]|nr:phosphate signaling complex protein PhoU [Fimbriimonadales bacterium]